MSGGIGKLALAIACTIALAACQFDRGAPAPESAAPQAAAPNALQCFNCHSREQVFGPRASESGTLLGALRTLDAGLERASVLVPGDVEHYALTIASRGRHPEDLERDACWSCHPVTADGTGHGQRIYAVADPLAPGVDCASGCHTWLGESVEQVSPAGTRYSGTLRPGQLLAQPGNPHATVWGAGWHRDDNDHQYVVQAIAPGCGGCHVVDDVSHGAAPDCLRCHAWDGPDDVGGPHAAHQGYITAIGGATGDMADDCGWCHGFGAAIGSTVAQPACYNCHLSGHAPLGDDGEPQLWR